MPDSWVVEVVSLFSGVAGVLSFVVSLIVDVVSQHDRSPRSRKITGWLATALGLATAGMLAAAVIDSEMDIWWSTNAWPTVGVCASLVLTVAGAWRALTLAGDRPDAPVRRILNALTERADGQARPPEYQPLPAVEKNPRRKLLRTRTLVTWSLKLRGGLVAVESPAGTGKSVEFQEVTRLLAERARRSRRVKLMPVYIDVCEILSAGLPLSTDGLREHIKTTVRARDEYLVEELDLHLRGAREHVGWVFFLDSFDQVDRAAQDDALRALADLVRPKNFRAIIAAQSPVESSRVRRRLELDFSSFRWRRAFLNSFDLTPEVRDWLLRWADRVGDLGRDQIGPYLFRLLAEHFEQVSAVPTGDTFYDVVDSVIEWRSARKERPSDAIFFAEELAYARLARLPRPTDEDLICSLVDAGLLVARNGHPVDFPDASLLTHFAIRRLLRVPDEPAAKVLLIEDAWRLPVLGLLERCPPPQHTELLVAATTLLEQEGNRYKGVVRDIEPHLLGPAGLRPEARSATFDWPPVARRLLLKLAEGLRTRRDVLPPALSYIAGRFVVSAFVPYVLPHERADAVRTLSLCSQGVAKWALEGSLKTPHLPHPRKVAAEQLTWLPDMFDRLGIVPRIIALATALSDPRLLARILRDGAYPDGAEPRTFSDAAVGIVRVLQVFAAYVAVTAPILFTIEAIGQSDPSEARLCWALVAVCFLLSTLTQGHVLHPAVAITSGSALALGALLGAVAGVLNIGPALFLMLTGNADDGFADAFSALIALWPVAMSHRIIDDRKRPTLPEWILPHLKLLLSVPTRIPRQVYRESVTRNVRTLISGAVVAGGLIGLANADLPRIEGVAQEDLRHRLFVGMVVGLIAVNLIWGYLRGLVRYQKTRTTLATGPDSGTFLRLLSDRRNQKETERFFKAAESVKPGSLGPAYNALRDLFLALTHVNRCVQPDSKKAIKKAIWYTGEPEFVTPRFKEWIIEYDERYPGRLIWLAKRVRGRLSKAAELNKPSLTEAGSDLHE
jgi:hypothetical protein